MSRLRHVWWGRGRDGGVVGLLGRIGVGGTRADTATPYSVKYL